MEFLDNKKTSMTIITLHVGPEIILKLALLPLMAFVVIYIVSLNCNRFFSKRVGFDVAMISGYIFLFVSAVIGWGTLSYDFKSHGLDPIGGYLLKLFLAASISSCAFGFSLLCFRLRPDWKCKKVRFILMYLLMLLSLLLIVVICYHFDVLQKYITPIKTIRF
jgi:hypothetical protein